MKNERINELMAGMTAFNNTGISKEEYLPELKKLQSEIVNLTFNEEHASTGDLRIWDVEKHLRQMNDSYGNVADEELARFIEGSKELTNLIKAEISGTRGEFTVLSSLRNLHMSKIIIKNLELCEDEYHTEIDEIVITPAGITIIEVKNSSKNILIDEKGNYYRTGSYNKLDFNIADKMRVREQAVRDILEKAGFEDVQINGVVVFTNATIEVTNWCDSIVPVFVGQLPGTIENMTCGHYISIEVMKKMADCLRNKSHVGQYHIDMDIEKFKRDFATLMAKLEAASSSGSEQEEIPVSGPSVNSAETASTEPETSKKPGAWKKRLLTVGKILGTVAISTATTLIVNAITGRNK